MTGGLQRIAFRVPSEELESARARVLALAPEGFEEVDRGTHVELAVYAETGRAADVLTALPGASASPVPGGWEHAWRAFHRPEVAGGVWLGPPWEEPPPELPAVVIDPGQAFGTGAHPTTRLCVELLARLERGSLLDVGCGSGVLAIAAERLGFGPLHAVDVDPVAVAVTKTNAAANGIVLDVAVAEATSDELPASDVAVVNIALDTVNALLARLAAREVVTSGYLVGERPSSPRWTTVFRLELDGWAADHLRRTSV